MVIFAIFVLVLGAHFKYCVVGTKKIPNKYTKVA